MSKIIFNSFQNKSIISVLFFFNYLFYSCLGLILAGLLLKRHYYNYLYLDLLLICFVAGLE